MFMMMRMNFLVLVTTFTVLSWNASPTLGIKCYEYTWLIGKNPVDCNEWKLPLLGFTVPAIFTYDRCFKLAPFGHVRRDGAFVLEGCASKVLEDREQLRERITQRKRGWNFCEGDFCNAAANVSGLSKWLSVVGILCVFLFD